MLDFLKKMDKKFLITCSLLIVVPLLIIVLLMILQGCEGKVNSFDSYEDKMVKKAQSYFEYHQLLPKNNGKEAIVTLEELENDGLKSASKALKDDSCTGSVTVKNNGGYYNYIPYLECSEYKTKYLIDRLKKKIVKKESGLYRIGNEYIYKGNKVDNYVKLYNEEYRIIGIDSDNNIRMIKTMYEDDQVYWDNKYNVAAEDTVGINDYYNSSIYDYLWKIYDNKKRVSTEMKKHLVGQTICLDKRSESDLEISRGVCINTLKDQFITIPSVYDYTLASYDDNCLKIGDGACANFNYMSDVISTSWTINASSDDTYSVYYISGSYIESRDASTYLPLYWVISISGNEIVKSGDGTLEKPFIIKQ